MDAFEDWIEHGSARRVGQTESEPYVMRFLRADDLDEVFALHRRIVAGLSHPHLFRPDSRPFMARHIGERGRTVGIYCAGALVAYAAISFPGDDDDNLGLDLPVPPNELHNVGNYEGSAVHPDYRGNRFQKLMTDVRHAFALAHDRYHILGTVSPMNPVSLANFLGVGCRVKNIKTKYDGMVRLIIHRDLREDAPPRLSPATFIDIPLSAMETQARLLHVGFQGFRVVLGDAEPCLRLGLPDETGVGAGTAAQAIL